MHVEHLPKANVLGVDLLNATSLLGLLRWDAAEYVLCLVHAALRPLLLVLVVSQMSAATSSIGGVLVLLLLLVLLEPEPLGHAVLD